jgi:hypothetical protein
MKIRMTTDVATAVRMILAICFFLSVAPGFHAYTLYKSHDARAPYVLGASLIFSGIFICFVGFKAWMYFGAKNFAQDFGRAVPNNHEDFDIVQPNVNYHLREQALLCAKARDDKELFMQEMKNLLIADDATTNANLIRRIGFDNAIADADAVFDQRYQSAKRVGFHMYENQLAYVNLVNPS